MRYIGRRLLALFILLILITISVALTYHTMAQATVQTKTLDRDQEPVIITGAQVPALIGALIGHLFIYTYTGIEWGDQTPIQVDEVIDGEYVVVANGELDNNDEIVFMTMDLGDQAPDMALLPTTLPISATWYEIEVTDPIDPAKKGWAYLVRSNVLTPSVSIDYVDYIAPTISTSHYELGLASSYPGFDYMALNGGLDILDRTKLRAIISGILDFEEDGLDGADIHLIKDGPVRVVLQQSATASILGNQASFNNTFLTYASFVHTVAEISFTLNVGTLTRIRTSIDLNSAASGATFYNALTPPEGVTVDGNQDFDDYDLRPLSTWAQINHPTGRVIQVTDPTSVGGTQSTYYCDDNSGSGECDGTDTTGDGVSYGETGFAFSGSVNNTSTITISLFVLPAADGENVGEIYQDYVNQPLQITVIPMGGFDNTVYLPILIK